jgi:hypothetical protein
LAKIAVRAANTADSTAQSCQDDRVSGFIGRPQREIISPFPWI